MHCYQLIAIAVGLIFSVISVTSSDIAHSAQKGVESKDTESSKGGKSVKDVKLMEGKIHTDSKSLVGGKSSKGAKRSKVHKIFKSKGGKSDKIVKRSNGSKSFKSKKAKDDEGMMSSGGSKVIKSKNNNKAKRTKAPTYGKVVDRKNPETTRTPKDGSGGRQKYPKRAKAPTRTKRQERYYQEQEDCRKRWEEYTNNNKGERDRKLFSCKQIPGSIKTKAHR